MSWGVAPSSGCTPLHVSVSDHFSLLTRAKVRSHPKRKNVARSMTAQMQYTPPSEKELRELLKFQPLEAVCEQAAALRDQTRQIITFSPKVFLPLTRLCRDSCGYCTFAQPPVEGRRAYMTLEEVLQVAVLGAKQGCAEALFTLGDKPELVYPEAEKELREMGYSSTLEYVAEASRVVMEQTGLLPHVNAGVLCRSDFQALKAVSGSQGLMLEATSERLMQPGGAHFNCPDKDPKARLGAIRAAGEAAVPFTSGLLIGIGETREERIDALYSLRELHAEHGHLEELIIQNFQPKKGTAMAGCKPPSMEEICWTIAAARLIFGPTMNIQAPPNLAPGSKGEQEGSWSWLLAAGINDWGGLSPLTRDFVNPEKPWPHLASLAAVTAKSGKALVPRLTLYPEYALDAERWLDSSGGRKSVAAHVLKLSDAAGLLRGNPWAAGQSDAGPPNAVPSISQQRQTATPTAVTGKHISTPLPRPKHKGWGVTLGRDGILDVGLKPPARQRTLDILSSVLDDGHELSEDEMVELFTARGADFDAVCSAADTMRRRLKGDEVSYAVVRNINYTNVCTFACGFCAFSKGKLAEDLRGAAYLLDTTEVRRRTAEAWDRGASEVCLQGGIHPDFTGDTYLGILEACKGAAPDIHVHAFSPLEVSQGAATLGWTLRRYLETLRDAGLGSLPGTAAEVLDDEVRAVLCPDKLSTSEWLEVIETAHQVGIATTSTIMFGHCDSTRSWARHLKALRDVQSRTRGITEFVPLPFVHMEAPIFLKVRNITLDVGKARPGPTLRECYLMHSVARLALAGYIDNIQASWVKMGPERAVSLMQAGCNDMGGTLMNESITRAAGASFGQELPPERMEELIISAGRRPRQRTTSYDPVFPSQNAKSFGAEALTPLNMEQFHLARKP